jgi:hypothetical protein
VVAFARRADSRLLTPAFVSDLIDVDTGIAGC